MLTSTWAMKKKSNGKFRARLNACGYEHVDGEHYDKNTKSALVTNEMTIHIVLILMIMAGWYAEVWMSVVPSCMVFLQMERRSTWKFLKDLSIGIQISMFCCC